MKSIINSIFKDKPAIDAIAWDGKIHLRPGYVMLPASQAHEEIHLKQQKETGQCWWLIKYLCSKKFKLSQEVEAFKAQVKAGANIQWAALMLSENYDLNISQFEALTLLERKAAPEHKSHS